MKPLVLFPKLPVIVLTPHGVRRAEWWSEEPAFRYFVTKLEKPARYGAYRVLEDTAGRTIIVGLYEGGNFDRALRACRDAERAEQGTEAQRDRGTKETLSVPQCLCASAPLPKPRRVERTVR